MIYWTGEADAVAAHVEHAIDAIAAPDDAVTHDRVHRYVCDVRDRDSIFEIIGRARSDQSAMPRP